MFLTEFTQNYEKKNVRGVQFTSKFCFKYLNSSLVEFVVVLN